MGKQLALIWLDQQHPLLATSDTVKVGALTEVDGVEVLQIIKHIWTLSRLLGLDCPP